MSKRAQSKRATLLVEAALRHHRGGKLDQAALLYEQALRWGSPVGAVLSNLGEAYRGLGRKAEAAATFRRAVELQPDLAEAQYNLGLTLDQLGRFSEAIPAYEAALQLKPELPNVAALLIDALRDNSEYERGIATYARVAALVPDTAQLRRAVANSLADVFRVDEAILHFQRALELEPLSPELHIDYAAALLECGQLTDALAELRTALRLDPSQVRAHASLVYLLAFDEAAEPQQILQEALRFDRLHTAAMPRPSSYAKRALERRRIRVGYVSPDFRVHATAYFIPELFRHHDRNEVEVFCYSCVRRPDSATADITALADQTRDISTQSDEDAARQIMADEIDVLVDLAMHTGQSRPLLFARKPAPIQVCWLAYPGTTGLSAMDYRLTDPHLDPPGHYDADYSERSVRLADTFWCYGPPSTDPDVTPLPALANGYVTFGSLNSFKKVSPSSIALWAKVLAAVPDSRMLIVTPPGLARERTRRQFEAAGIEPTRIEQALHAPRAGYLENFQRIDCCLDPTPYNGGTTSLDAFWMGVPVVTLVGRTVVGRAGASLAYNLGLPELVTTQPEEYVALASALSSDLGRLAELRRTLRSRMQRSPLMDAPRFARSLEGAYRDMLATWRKTSEG